jgi:hypothetical protein
MAQPRRACNIFNETSLSWQSLRSEAPPDPPAPLVNLIKAFKVIRPRCHRRLARSPDPPSGESNGVPSRPANDAPGAPADGGGSSEQQGSAHLPETAATPRRRSGVSLFWPTPLYAMFAACLSPMTPSAALRIIQQHGNNATAKGARDDRSIASQGRRLRRQLAADHCGDRRDRHAVD